MLKSYNLLNQEMIPAEKDTGNVVIFINPDIVERNYIIDTYEIDEHALASALDPDEISRVEFNLTNTLLIWKYPQKLLSQNTPHFNVSSCGLFLLKDKLIIIIEEEVTLFDSKHNYKLETITDYIMGFLYMTIHHYLDHLKVIKMISREVQEKINASMENEYLIQMFNLSETLVYYLNAISSNGIVLNKLKTDYAKLNLPKENLEILDDIIIENNQCYKQAEIYLHIFSDLMDARSGLVNNNMNVLMKNLTIINIIFLPLNLIASILGMSEFSFMTKNIDWRISYSLFFASMVLLGWFTLTFIRKINLHKRVLFQDRKRRRRIKKL